MVIHNSKYLSEHDLLDFSYCNKGSCFGTHHETNKKKSKIYLKIILDLFRLKKIGNYIYLFLLYFTELG